MKTIKFYDTSSLLLKPEDNHDFLISSITLEELENIKTSSHKDAELKAKARELSRWLDENENKYAVINYKEKYLKPIKKESLEINNDAKILACAIAANRKLPSLNLIFVSNDINLRHLARLFFTKDRIESIHLTPPPEYTGFKNVRMDEMELEEFYQNPNRNTYNLLPNQYLIIYNEDNDIIDLRCWTGQEYRYLEAKPINTKFFGKLSPLDLYQKMAFDSLRNNQLIVLRGSAGVGKSQIGLTYLFSLLESHAIERIYIFCNPVATKDSAKLGFYPGERDDKLLDSQIGNFLIGKFGDISIIEQLVHDGKLILVPAADCRGMSISDGSGVYITEAQNSTVSLMKLMIQRVGENVKCVIEGDDKAQVDLQSYEGKNNGLQRLSEVFRGQDFYGEVTLQKCYRSKIAATAELM